VLHFASELVQRAAHLIKRGDLVAFPTETVYGIGADARNDAACQKIYQLKGRSGNNPLIVHVTSLQTAVSIAAFSNAAMLLASKFWPGPLTLVLPLQPGANIASSVTAGLNTIAIRMPSYSIAHELITLANTPIAAPSANPSGYVSATAEEHVKMHFPDLFVLPSDSKPHGLESTIVDLTSEDPVILRYGFITPEILSQVLGQDVVYHTNADIKAPGMLSKHYSPKAYIRLNATTLHAGEKGIGFGRIVLGPLNLSKSGDLVEAATNLYSMLITLDNMKDTHLIAIAPIPQSGIGLAINDRLTRAIATCD